MAKVRYFLSFDDQIPAKYATVYSRGAVVNGAQSSVTTVTVHQPHEIAANDKFYYAETRFNVIQGRVFTASGSAVTSVTFAGGYSFPDKALLVNLENDTGCVLNSDGTFTKPNFDGSGVAIYKDVNGDATYANATVPVEPGGEVGWYGDGGTYWIVLRDAADRIVRVYLDIGAFPSTTGLSGPSPSVDNEIARWDGVAGTTLQGYASGGPTIGDTGAMLVPENITVGAAGGSAGAVAFKGSTSGTATVVAPAAAGTPTLTLTTQTGVLHSGPAATTDNALVRWDGASGLAVQDYLSGAPSASDTGVLSVPVSANITIARFNSKPWYDLSHPAFGVAADGATDDAPAIQAAIDAAAAGANDGVVFFPAGSYRIGSTITLAEGVKLVGEHYTGKIYLYTTTMGARIRSLNSFTGTAMFTTPASCQYWGVRIQDLHLDGNQVVENGVVLDGSTHVELYDLSVNFFTKSAIWCIRRPGIGLETRMRNINGLGNNTAAAASRRGVFHIEHTDCWLENCRASVGATVDYSSGGNRCGFYISGSNNWMDNCYADFNEDGIVVDAPGLLMNNCRADNNKGHAFVATANVTSGCWSNCLSVDNGTGASNTYDGFSIAATGLQLAACHAHKVNASATLKYAFNQTSAFGSKNSFVGCEASGSAYTTALWNDVNSAGGWLTRNVRLNATADDTTPTVKNCNLLVTAANSGATAITQLDDGHPGQRVTIECGSNTNSATIANGGNFRLFGGNWSPSDGQTLTVYTLNGTTWIEESRNTYVTGGASSTDNAIVRFDGTSGRVLQNYTSGAPTIGDTGDFSIPGNVTMTGRLIVRTVSVDPAGSATDGTIGEIVYSSSTAKFYGKHTTSANDTNWRLLGT